MDSARALRRRYAAYRWTPARNGASGAEVHRLTHPGGAGPELYVKIAPAAYEGSSLDLSGEADRLTWLGGRGIPVPRLVERGTDGEATWLVTEALPGRPAAERWPEDRRFAVVEALADITRALHELPSADCPFDRSLAVTQAQAVRNVQEGLVDLDDLDEEREGWSGRRLLDELDRTRPAAEDLVVTHGDLTSENVLIDPETCRVTGVIDVIRLGRADRHTDLAIALRELESEEDPWFGPVHAAHFLERYLQGAAGKVVVDEDRLAFYRLLDEFF
ncbi:aminoglycoside O-phosphotransferase APH(3')-Va [Streptomyces sp. WAC 01529]|uniref:APH(3') family aminoglycoside O-phosphotransferase n=1 Tax=Streptomyces sp. WAC 01529 TaxID=2203205 RepID=UPI000F6DFDF2|nr:APH(3') family aminoglycoside O-phosphotransferase [Streptomyces sp. WAC 01529]AZM57395.1 aminoglycoside O-phosphotransferase APH(3')-Va [Streptomyces sp. WAC 01529]